MQFPIDAVREKFPALSLTDEGVRRIYLDNPAGTQVPRGVADAVARCLIETNANLGGYFSTSRAAQEIVAGAHQAMAELLGAAGPEEIVIGANMTTLTYHFSRTLGRGWKAGDEIVVTQMDHDGNVAPWVQLAEERGMTIRKVPFDENTWQVEEEALQAALGERTRLVALSYASNLTGSINRVAALTALAKAAGALVYVDAVQFAPHGLIDVEALGCDFLACSSYKFFGPHLGILWGRRAVLEELEPYKCRCSSNELPGRFETGTPQIELLAGLTATVEHFGELGAEFGIGGPLRKRLTTAFARSVAYEGLLAQRLIDGLAGIAGLTIHGITDPARIEHRVPTISFTVEGLDPATLVAQLAAENIFVWSGHNYAWEVVQQLKIPTEEGVVRIGIANYNTAEEIDETLESVTRNLAMLRQER